MMQVIQELDDYGSPVQVRLSEHGGFVRIEESGTCIFLSTKALASITETVARYLKCKDCGNEGSAALFRTNPANGLSLCAACEGYEDEGPIGEYVNRCEQLEKWSGNNLCIACEEYDHE